MKFAAITAVSAGLMALAVAGQAAAKEQEVEIKDAVARVIVIVEDRADVGVEVSQGTSGLPALTVRREGGRVVIDGHLGRSFGRSQIRNCRTADGITQQPGQGSSVEVRDVGRVNLTDAPMITLRMPRSVDLDVDGAVFGAIGRGASSVELGNQGCGDWTVGNTDGAVSLSLAGSGDVNLGTSRSLEVSIAGAGDVSAGTTGGLDISIAGAGSLNLQAVNGPIDTSIAGSGDVTIRGGQATAMSVSIAGAGDVDFRGTAATLDANILGAGDIRVQRVTGNVSRSVLGAGDITIG